MVGAFYMLLWRPQQRRIAMVRDLQSQVQVGDEILGRGGARVGDVDLVRRPGADADRLRAKLAIRSIVAMRTIITKADGARSRAGCRRRRAAPVSRPPGSEANCGKNVTVCDAGSAAMAEIGSISA